MSTEFLIYSVYGYLPAKLIFLFGQFYVLCGILIVATINISSVLQVAIISNLRSRY